MNLNVKRERSINDFLMQKLPAEEKKSAIPALNLFTIVRYFFLSLNSEKLPPLLSLLPASSLLLVLFSIFWLCLYALDSSCEWSLMDLCVRRVESSSSVIRCRISSSWFLKNYLPSNYPPLLQLTWISFQTFFLLHYYFNTSLSRRRSAPTHK